jgi:hypothetical protein
MIKYKNILPAFSLFVFKCIIIFSLPHLQGSVGVISDGSIVTSSVLLAIPIQEDVIGKV